MHDRLLAFYHRLPASARSGAATLRGLYLRYWRTDADSADLELAALARDTWSAEQWRTWRDERLAYVLHRAATRVPYYRALWAQRRRQGDRASWERLEHWRLLEKDAVRAQPRAFLADDCDRRRMFHEQTSGTTGKPLDLWLARRTLTTLHAMDVARTERWEGIPLGTRYARLGGQLVTPVRQRRPPFWVWNAAMHQLYMSTFHLAPDLIPHYLDALVRYRIVYLTGYPSSLAALAHAALRLGRTDLRMAAVFTNAEPLTTDQRESIAAAFQCPVREGYGMAEMVAAGTECPSGRLHQWPEVGHLEVWGNGGPVEAGATGELVGTSLVNADMPLVRYRVGDRGRLAPAHERCACGRTLPLINGVEGRSTDLLIGRDGRQVFWLNPVFYGLPVRESQIVQETLDRIRVRVAPAPGFTDSSARTITERLCQRLGDVEVQLEHVESVPRTASGKVRAVVCNLDPAVRHAVLAESAAGA